MPHNPRALMIGGSLSGLLCANLLRSIGWHVDVFEKVPEELAGRGAGIATHAELIEVLRRCGVCIDETFGVEVPGRITLDGAGQVIAEFPFKQIMTAWSRVYRLLRDNFPDDRYHQGCSLERVEQDESSVTAVFSSGERATGDLLVGADGIRSTVRAQFLPEIKPLYAGYVGWRGLIEESALSPATHAAIFEKFVFCLPNGEQMLAYPVAGAGNTTTPGSRRYNFVWYRPADEARTLKDLLTDDSGCTHEISIPPPLIRKPFIERVRGDAQTRLAPQLAEVVARTEPLFFQPIYDVESPRIAFGRVALVGDAAFTARPHIGMGVTKAAGDAAMLADALLATSNDCARALDLFEAQRQPFGAKIIAHTRYLGAYLQAQLQTEQERRMAERNHTPEMVMRETALPPP
jgi:2-polyprenyl-6-methoxyphenol hydroxylase-like FAD-dependent oxidoreductase